MRLMRRAQGREAGFTLIEVMVVVVLLGILASIAVSQFMEESNKTKANSEVMAFFAEMHVRQEQFRVENSAYFPVPVGATTACPATTSPSGTTLDCTAAGKPWIGLNVAPPTPEVYCSYIMRSGTGAGTGNQTINGAVFNFTSPAGVWYWLQAECDLDSDGTKITFFSSSMDSTVQKSTEGAD
jgi:prepilin-type N-terminal cleavage/methylation domain-containing protein